MKKNLTYIGNDKSTFGVYLREYKDFFNPKFDIEVLKEITTKLNDFEKYLIENKIIKEENVIRGTHKTIFQFENCDIEMKRVRPFSVIFKINPIKIIHKSYFNYLRKNFSFGVTKQLVLKRYKQYMSLLSRFIGKNNLKGSLFYDDYFIRLKEGVLRLLSLSVTMDKKFNSEIERRKIMILVEELNILKYLKYVIEKENIYFQPYNKNTVSNIKDLPRFRCYYKWLDLRKLKKEIHLKLLKGKRDSQEYRKIKRDFDKVKIYSNGLLNFDLFEIEYRNKLKEFNESFNERLDVKKLKKEYNQALYDLKNVLRFELEFGKESIKKFFSSNVVVDFNAKIDNKPYIHYAIKNKLIPMKKVSNRSIIKNFIKEKIKDYYKEIKEVRLDTLLRVMQDYKDILLLFPNTPMDIAKILGKRTKVIYDDLRYLRKIEVIKGKGRNMVINYPYNQLLRLFVSYRSVVNY